MSHPPFGSWQHLANTQEIPHPGDFLVRLLGRRSVIVVRGADGQIRVLLNTCRHRNVPVCRQAQGNTARFTCVDHGWVYDTNGSLVGLSGPNQSIHHFRERRGLPPVPRMAIHEGAIFASLSPEGESLVVALRQERGKEA